MYPGPSEGPPSGQAYFSTSPATASSGPTHAGLMVIVRASGVPTRSIGPESLRGQFWRPDDADDVDGGYPFSLSADSYKDVQMSGPRRGCRAKGMPSGIDVYSLSCKA